MIVKGFILLCTLLDGSGLDLLLHILSFVRSHYSFLLFVSCPVLSFTMATVTTQSMSRTTLHSHVTIPQLETINSINDFIVHQAQSIPDTALIAYPSSELGAADFENYSAKHLDILADEAAKTLASQGLVPRVKTLPGATNTSTDSR